VAGTIWDLWELAAFCGRIKRRWGRAWTPSVGVGNSKVARAPDMSGLFLSQSDFWIFPCDLSSPQIETDPHRLAG
jgi:hypothetical protein